MRPTSLRNDDSLYVDDDSTIVVKAEECESRRVFRKTATPYLGPTEHVVLSDSDMSDIDTSPYKAFSNEGIPGKTCASTFIFNKH